MAKFRVTIKETLMLTVEKEAETFDEALNAVIDEYRAGKHVLTADNYVDTDFGATEVGGSYTVLKHYRDGLDAKTTNNANKARKIEEGVDAVFLPGKIHGCEDELYIIYFNPCACDGKGCWEIEIVDYDRILELYEEVDGNDEEFFALLPDWFQGEWCYCDADHEGFEEYSEIYWEADFIVGRDGIGHDEMMFLVNWARKREAFYRGDKRVRMTVEFEIDGDTLKDKQVSAEDAVHSIVIHDHDTIDGFEIYPQLDVSDPCCDFFLKNASVVSKEIVEETATQELVDRVKKEQKMKHYRGQARKPIA